jgi:hypothetical protein
MMGLSEEEFWRCTPRKFFALWRIYEEQHGLKPQKPQVLKYGDFLF